MKRFVSLFAFILFSSVNAQSQCGFSQIMTPRGCLLKCSSDKFKNCPDRITKDIESNFCALNEEGEWIQYTNQCRACTNPQIYAIKKGKCDKNEQNLYNLPQKLQKLGKKQKPIFIKPYLPPNSKIQCGKNKYCENWEFCSLGKCFDNCARMRCASGCQKGACVKKNLKAVN